MSQQTVARSRERRAEKDKKEIGRHGTVFRQGYMLGAGSCSEAEDSARKKSHWAVWELVGSDTYCCGLSGSWAVIDLQKGFKAGKWQP